MSIFDRLKQANPAADDPHEAFHEEAWRELKMQNFQFARLPENLRELLDLPESALETPFQTAALTVLALCVYAADPAKGTEMLNYLQGPRALSAYDKQFLRDRLVGKTYKPFSFFEGAVPENNYTADQPFSLTVRTQAHSFAQVGQVALYLKSGGADTERPIILRPHGDRWYLWEQLLLPDIRKPASENIWR